MKSGRRSIERRPTLIGAIIGDIVGSVYEFHNINTKDFPLFGEKSRFTDDTVMTVAVAEGLMDSMGEDDVSVENHIIDAMHRWAEKYPNSGYGSKFFRWLAKKSRTPYGSYGNGSAMRVSSAAWLFTELDDVLKYAEISARVTHDHPEGVKGAQATAHAIWLAQRTSHRNDIKYAISEKYGYDIGRSIDEITRSEHGPEICQVTVPDALMCFFASSSFEDCIRNAVSIGGDSDTLAAIAGSIAEAYYNQRLFESNIWQQAAQYLPGDLLTVINRFIDTTRSNAARSSLYKNDGVVFKKDRHMKFLTLEEKWEQDPMDGIIWTKPPRQKE
jgi:ADP-ribosylglycohydrolase